MAKFIDRSRAFNEQLKIANRSGLQASMKAYVRLAKADVNKPFPPASKEGKPPHKRTGVGRNAITYRTIKQKDGSYLGRIGVTEEGIHMIYLELGTKTIARRPWMLSPLRRNRALLAKLAIGKIK